jgi:hypothetical protein
MPISNEEWNSGRTADTLEGQILAFLKRNMFPVNYDEIISSLGYSKDLNLNNLVAAFSIQNALDKLVKEGIVEAKTIKKPIGEQVYYKVIDGKLLF